MAVKIIGADERHRRQTFSRAAIKRGVELFRKEGIKALGKYT